MSSRKLSWIHIIEKHSGGAHPLDVFVDVFVALDRGFEVRVVKMSDDWWSWLVRRIEGDRVKGSLFMRVSGVALAQDLSRSYDEAVKQAEQACAAL